MKTLVTVDKAISRLKLILVNLFITMSLLMGLALYSLQFQAYQFGLFLSLFFFSFVAPPLLTAFLMYKWKYWAFESVRNVHELKRRTILTKWVSENDKFFTNLDSCDETDTKHWKLKEKFSEADVFVDDISIPDEVCIFYSRALIFFYLFLSIFVSAGLTFILIKNVIISVITAFVAFVIFLRINSAKLRQANPIIKISIQGIEIGSAITSWENIKKDDIVSVGSGSYTKQYLIYHSPKGLERICITGLNIGPIKLGKLLTLFRNRYLHNK